MHRQSETGGLNMRQAGGLAGNQDLVDHAELGIGPLTGKRRRQVPDLIARPVVACPVPVSTTTPDTSLPIAAGSATWSR
jgi:hypothetical protein